MISNELYQSICILDNDTCKGIANTLKSNLNNIILTGFELDESFANGYVKASNLVIELLLSDSNSKKDTLKQINEIDLSEYMHYSCKSSFNRGFNDAINQLNLEIENIYTNKL